MEKRELCIEKRYVTIPIWTGQPLEKLEVFCEAADGAGDGTPEKIFEFCVPSGPGAKGAEKSFDAVLPVDGWIGKKLIFFGRFSDAFFCDIQNQEQKPCVNDAAEKKKRPVLHFTSETGWINDPNGLVYQDGVYHLYFQYNPFGVEWGNMCWGHARSTDLLHWEQQDPVLFPDENGTMFSGSGIVNEKAFLELPDDALIFFYTAAAGCNEWTQEKRFTQRTAYSTDGGKTLVKTDRGVLPPVGEESRDPKVFWHEESRAYIMVLWLYDDVFGIFRSGDLEGWQESDRVRLDKGWECPDLFSLKDDDGREQWMFLTADGYYYLGEFDGWHFRQTQDRRCAYLNHAPYAAQTYSNVDDRRLLVAWLRLSFEGENYAGAMSLPRELSLTGAGDNARLCMKPVRELKEWLGRTDDVAFRSVRCDIDRQYQWEICGVAVSYDRMSGAFAVNDETLAIPAGISDFSFLLDGSILEVTADGDTLMGAVEV